MRLNKSALILPALLGLCVTPAHAQLVITPTYDSTITSDPNAAAIENSIQADINFYETKFTNPVTVSILFNEDQTIGLGQSSTFIGTVNYNDYAAALKKNEQGQSFLVSVTGDTTNPNTPNPVNGSTQVTTSLANLRTLGFSSGNLSNFGLTYDSTISLKTSDMNLSRSGSQAAFKYDLQAVASHEIDEVLGLSSALDNANSKAGFDPNGPIGPLDLFRYSGNGVRSFDTSKSTASYLSADGGKNYIVYFNQTAGADYHDWYSDGSNPKAVLGSPQVQDAFGSPGKTEDLGASEFTALQMVGYNLAAAPEPSQFAALGLGILGLGGLTLRARRRSA